MSPAPFEVGVLKSIFIHGYRVLKWVNPVDFCFFRQHADSYPTSHGTVGKAYLYSLRKSHNSSRFHRVWARTLWVRSTVAPSTIRIYNWVFLIYQSFLNDLEVASEWVSEWVSECVSEYEWVSVFRFHPPPPLPRCPGVPWCELHLILVWPAGAARSWGGRVTGGRWSPWVVPARCTGWSSMNWDTSSDSGTNTAGQLVPYTS